MSDLSAIRTRLRALKAKTVENGCTEEEAMAAAEKMAELLSRHGMSEADLDAEEYDETAVYVGRRSPLSPVWKAIAHFADCKGFYTTTETGRHYVYFGTSSDVLVAEYIHDVMASACKRAGADFKATGTYTRRRTRKTRAAAVRAFQEALAATLVRKLVEGLWRRYRVRSTFEQAHQAIALRNERLDAKAEGAGHSFRNLAAIAKAEGKFKQEAHFSGFRAGEAIEIHAGMAAGNKITGVLGGGA